MGAGGPGRPAVASPTVRTPYTDTLPARVPVSQTNDSPNHQLFEEVTKKFTETDAELKQGNPEEESSMESRHLEKARINLPGEEKLLR